MLAKCCGGTYVTAAVAAVRNLCLTGRSCEPYGSAGCDGSVYFTSVLGNSAKDRPGTTMMAAAEAPCPSLLHLSIAGLLEPACTDPRGLPWLSGVGDSTARV